MYPYQKVGYQYTEFEDTVSGHSEIQLYALTIGYLTRNFLYLVDIVQKLNFSIWFALISVIAPVPDVQLYVVQC